MKLHALWLAALLAAAPAGAQVVSGSVENARTGQGVEYASVTVVNEDGAVVVTTQADRNGRFTVHLPAPGRYAVHVSEPGFHSAGSRFTVTQGGSVHRRFRVSEANAEGMMRAERDLPGKRNGRPVDESRGPVGMPPR